ncbi:transposase-like zinc-binding domain-containing protein [Holospora obtusa]|uniref:IS1/IS1595 family N-terminal zinc-binding domain-containing protein n=1 Tax=Holospora obtusa TaxID=49893 RepID=UPI003B830734
MSKCDYSVVLRSSAMHCKKCNSENCIRNGIVRKVQRYKCKECGYNFVEGDKRGKSETAVKKALCLILYALAKASFSF